MKLKKIMLIGIILFAILTIGAVSASQDLNSSDVFTSDELGEEVVQDDSSDVLGDVEVKDGENEIEDEPLIFDSTDEECYVNLYLQPDSKGTLTVSVDGNSATLNVVGDTDDDDDEDFVITVNGGSKTEATLYGENYDDDENEAISNYASEEWSISFANLDPGDYTILINFTDLNKPNNPSYNLIKQFNLTRYSGNEEYDDDIEIEIEPCYTTHGNNSKIDFNLSDNQINNLTVIIDNVAHQLVDKAIDLSNLNKGEHSIVIIYGKDNVLVNTTFMIVEGIINGPKNPFIYKSPNQFISLSLPVDDEGYLVILDNGEEIKRINLENGLATYSLSQLSVGPHHIVAKYYGSIYVIGFDQELEVYPILNIPSRMTVGEKKYIVLEVDPNAKGTLEVYVDYLDRPYQTEDVSNGKAYILLDGLEDGDIEFEIVYMINDDNYDSSSDWYYDWQDIDLSITVDSVNPKIYAPNIKMTYLQNVVMDVKVFGTNGRLAEEDEDVEIEIGNNYYYDPSIGKNGIAKQKINVPPGKYTVKIYYGDTTIKRTLVVYHALKMSNVKVKKSAKKLVLKATLKVGKKAIKGKKVTFKFNGKKFKAKTNSKGVAKVTVNKKFLQKLKVGKKVKIQATYLKDTVKKSVKVKR